MVFDRSTVYVYIVALGGGETDDMSDNSPYIPDALDTLSTLMDDPTVHVRVICPFSPSWDESRGIKANLEEMVCGERIWRIGDGVRDVQGACASSVWIR